MQQFPDESKLPRSADGSEPIRGGSVALNMVLGLFVNRVRDPHVAWKMFLLNGETLFRNVYSSELTDAQLYEAFLKDCEILLVYIEAYLSRYLPNDGSKKFQFIVYFPNYDSIPKDIQRTPSASEISLNKAYRKFTGHFPLTPTMTSYGQYTNRWVLPVGSKARMPHVDLLLWLQKMSLDTRSTFFKWGDPVFLLTSFVTDLYLYRRMDNVELIERYTGLVKTSNQFGTKLLKSKERKDNPNLEIPLNIATHRAFGDDQQIAPIAMRNVRKALIEVALKNRWMIRSFESIVKDITTVTGVTAAELLKVRF